MVKTIFDNPSGILTLIRNCVFIKDGEVWYRDFEREIPLMELARNLNKAYGDSEASTMNDEAFSDKMHDDSQFKLEEDIDSFIATFYMALIGMAENRERLKIYETTGLPTTAYPEVLQECIDTYGADKQIDQTIKELSELTKALLKHRHLEGENVNPTSAADLVKARTDILERTADVIIMLTQIIMIFGDRDFIERIIESKVYRQRRALAEGDRWSELLK
jgi:hypothetical protein